MAESILIIDDEQRILQALARNLHLAGYTVFTAQSGRAGIESFTRERPAITFVDVRMPDLDGFAVLEAIRAQAPDAEVILMTGHGDKDTVIAALRADATDFISKPIEREVLESVLRRAQKRLHTKRELRAAQEALRASHASLEQQVAERTAELETSNAALREQELFLSTLLEAIPVPVFYKDATGHYLGFNRAFELFFGQSKAQLVGKTVFDISPQPLAKLYHEMDTRLLEHTGKQIYEAHLEAADGTQREVVFHKATFADAQGAVAGLIGAILDITEHKRAEIALQESAAELQRAQQVAQIGSWRMNLTTGAVTASQEAYRIYGLNEGELTIPQIQAIPLPAYRPALDAALRALIEQGQPYDIEFRIRRPADGALRDIHSVAEYDAERRIVIGVIQDITERQQAEISLRESEEKFRQIAENIGEVFWLRSADNSRMLYINPAYEKVWGRTCQSLYDYPNTFIDSVHTDDKPAVYAAFEKYMHDGKFDLEYRIVRPDGDIRWVQVRSFPVWDETKIVSYTGIAVDITDRKQAEAAFQKQHANMVAILENTQELICLRDRAHRVLLFNTPWANNIEELFGIEATVGMNTLDHLPTTERPVWEAIVERVLAGESYHDEFQWVFGAGDIRDYEIAFHPVKQADVIIGYSEFTQDITARKQAEAAIARQSHELHTLYAASQQFQSTLDPEQIYATIHAAIHQLLRCNALYVSSYDAASQLITCRAAWHEGAPMDVSNFPPLPLNPEGQGTQSLAIRTGQSLLLNDYEQYRASSRVSYYVDEKGALHNVVPDDAPRTRAALIVPLVVERQVTGVIQVFSDTLNAFTPDDLRLLEALAVHIAAALQNAALYQTAQREIAEREQAEAAMRDIQRLLHSVINTSTDFIFVKDTHLRTILCNTTFAQALGQQPEALYGKTDIENGWPPELVYGDPTRGFRGFATDDRDVLTGLTVHNPYDPATVGGVLRIFDTIKLPLYDDEGHISGVLGISRDVTERQQLLETLQTAQRQLEIILNTVPAMIWMKDRDGRYLQVNRAYGEAVGLTSQDILGKTDYDVFPFELADKYVRDDRAILAAGHPEFGMEERHLQPSGEQGWSRTDKLPYYDAAGQISGTIGFALDITAQKQAENMLCASEERYRLLVEAAIEGIWAMDAEHRTTYVNQAMADMLGYTPAEMLGKKVEEFFFAEDNAFHEKRMSQRHAGVNEVYERRLRRRDGTPLWTLVSAKALKDAAGRFAGSFAMFTDITARKAAEVALRKREAQYHALYMQSPIGIERYDADGLLVEVNPACLELFGIEEPHALAGFALFQDPNLADEHKAALKAGQTVRYQIAFDFEKVKTHNLYLTTCSGIKWLDVLITPLAGGHPGGYLVQVQDITTRQQAEEALQAAHAKLEALWSVASLADADLKTVSDHILASIVKMTGSAYGFYGFINADETDMIIHSWSGEAMRDCTMVDKPQCFLIREAGVWGEAIRRRAPLILNAYAAPHAAKRGLPEGHVVITKLLVVPFFSHDRITAIAAVANRAAPYGDEDIQQITAFLNSVQAITDSKRAEAALRESEEKHRRLFETMAQGVIYQAADGGIIAANHSAERILGLTFDQMQGKTSMDPRWRMVTEDGTTVPGTEHPAMVALRTGEQVGPLTRGVYIPEQDAYVWLFITAIPLFQPGEDKPYQVYATFDDITAQKQAREALELERRRFAMLFEMFPGYIYLQAPDYTIRYANQYFVQHFGAPEGRLCYEALHGRTTPCENCPTFAIFASKIPLVWEWEHPTSGKTYMIYDYPFIDSDESELVLEIGVDILNAR